MSSSLIIAEHQYIFSLRMMYITKGDDIFQVNNYLRLLSKIFGIYLQKV